MNIRTGVRAGECSQWYYGVVEEASGGGYYGAIIDEFGTKRYFNNGYTQFCPFREGVSVGQKVMFSPFLAPNERAGKVACLSPAPE